MEGFAKEFSTPTPVLRPGVIYLGDNGRAICDKCAGQSALYTGCDISGFEVFPIKGADVVEMWLIHNEGDLRCEEGCTVIPRAEIE